MSSSRIRIQIAVLAFILLPATLGVVAVHASATCERFVRTYVTRPVRNRLSKETADAWAAWRIAHPNWKPNPNSQRPKYVMTRDEAVQKVEFACAVPTIPTDGDLFFTAADLAAPPMVDLPPMETQVTIPDVAPPEIAELTPPVPILPAVPPTFPLVSTIVPEPDSLVLVGTGMGLMFLGFAATLRKGVPRIV
jgi:hypothetical protein